jgi:menaquinone-dependent protoporphyrinogen IX oxidase
VIALRLQRRGHEVIARPVARIGDTALRDQDAVVIGSAVYYGRWRKEAAAFGFARLIA